MKQLPIALYILALLGFFLPWSSLSCTIPGAGTVGIYQSGLQMVTKGYTEKKPDGGMGGGMGGMGGMGGGMGGMDDTDEMAEDLEPAFLPVATVLLTLIALVLALKSSAAANLVGILAGASALIQMVIGFPLKKVIEGGGGGGGGGELGMDPAEILAEMYHIEYGFWITVAASILAGILGFAGGSAAESPNAATATTATPSSPAAAPAAPAAPETVPPAAPAEPITESTAEHEAEGDAADAGESEE